jgi:hypothetical protein
MRGFGNHTLPRKEGFRLENLAAKKGNAKPATVICARCNQPTSGARTCGTCSKIGLRELHPDEINNARAAAVAEIMSTRRMQRAMQGWRSEG